MAKDGKPKKGLPEPPAQPEIKRPAQQYWRQRVAAAEEAEQIAVAIVQEIADAACERLSSNYFDQTAVPYACQCMAEQMLELIQMIFIVRDNGDDSVDDHASWLPDEEPAPLEIDSLARGAVPIRTMPLPRMDADMQPLNTTATRRPRVKPVDRDATSSISSARGPNHATLSVSIASTSAAVRTTGGPTPKPPTSARLMGSTSNSSFMKPERTGSNLDLAKPQGIDPKIAAEEQRKREAEEAERVSKLLATLKASGREFTVDNTGRVIPIKSVDRSLASRGGVELSMGVMEERLEAQRLKEEQMTAQQPKRQSYDMARRDKKRKPKAPKVPSGTWLQPEDSAGPMVEEVTPAGGVMLRTDDTAQRNDLKAMPGRITRQEFTRTVDAQDLANAQESLTQSFVQQPVGGGHQRSAKASTARNGKMDVLGAFPDPSTGFHPAPPHGTADLRGSAAAPALSPLQQLQEAHQQQLHPSSLVQSFKPPEQYKPQHAGALPTAHGDFAAVLGDRPRFPRERPHVHRSVMGRHKFLPAPLYPSTHRPNTSDAGSPHSDYQQM